jgi:hypothetical protein
VIYDGRSATPRHVLVIALAGPAANLVGAAVIAALAVRAEGMLSVVLFLWMLASLATAVAKSATRWRSRYTGASYASCMEPAHRDPNAATSIPPPAG